MPTGIFIGNEFRKAISGNKFGVENPATGGEILQIEEAARTMSMKPSRSRRSCQSLLNG